MEAERIACDVCERKSVGNDVCSSLSNGNYYGNRTRAEDMEIMTRRQQCEDCKCIVCFNFETPAYPDILKFYT